MKPKEDNANNATPDQGRKARCLPEPEATGPAPPAPEAMLRIVGILLLLCLLLAVGSTGDFLFSGEFSGKVQLALAGDERRRRLPLLDQGRRRSAFQFQRPPAANWSWQATAPSTW